jgi:hypothetical protein
MKETFPTTFDALGYKYGKDKRGIPVTYNFYKGLSEDGMLGQLEQFKRWRVQLLESAIQDLDFEKGQETILQVRFSITLGNVSSTQCRFMTTRESRSLAIVKSRPSAAN